MNGSDVNDSEKSGNDVNNSTDKEIHVPTPPPTPPRPISDEELQAAVNSLLESLPYPGQPAKHQALRELPRWIDKSEIPDLYECDDPHLSGPEYCNQCGARYPYGRPLERGYVIENEGEDGNPWYNHCPKGKYNIQNCTCCGCPQCGAKSIYKRASKYPPFRCRNPRCKAEFSHPIERFEDENIRTKLYWACRVCDTAILAPFDGVPDAYFSGTESQSASETGAFSNPVENRG